MKIIDETKDRLDYPKGLKPGDVIKVKADDKPAFFMISNGYQEITLSTGQIAYKNIYKFVNLGDGSTEGFGMKFGHGYKSIDEMMKAFVNKGCKITVIDAEVILKDKGE